ncbi:AMP-dependent synthetase and ligase [Luminiphilus syltensis NOR5-1B]|uniref:AMP-dependent synthetase and ligase n=1 Tax=Luminiphilus syltensis NOR5-1B TaxID=565045 RepID=B8KVA3_9GAMM|nr:long-chain fatty acid--CoA ligase [Luminiphilus syltensis]EED34495.1 AMP-dependent synthetase and ligase [Luminiphilus syltensis NOR5-1B]
MISLSALIERAVRKNPNGLSTRFKGREQTYAEFKANVSRLGGALQTLGLEPGDRVAILSLNSDRYLEAIFGISWGGFCMVPLNTRWALPENEYAVGDSGVRALLFDDTFSEQAKALLESVADLSTVIYMDDGQCPPWALSYRQLIEDSPPVTASDRSGEDLAGIFYTGGTTGFPKGVMQSHRALWASAIGCMPEFAMSRSSVYLHVAPMFHVADFVGTMASVIEAACHVMLPGFEPSVVLKTLAKERISHSLMVPAMIKMLMNHPEASSTDVSHLQYVLYGASPMPAATLQQFMATWPEVDLIQAYGQTELAPVVSLMAADAHRRGGHLLKSAGKPTVVSDVRIVDESGQDLPLGGRGEIIVTGPHTMLGYWNKPEETAKALRDGWVYTGDAGYLDDEGFLYIVDRVKDMVVTGGENVFTTEVENAVISHDAVQDVAVIGIPHPEWGEAVHAVVVLQPGAAVTEDEIIAHCRDQIAGYKLPKSVSFRDEPLPLSGAGKVLKRELRAPFWEGQDRQVG